MISPSIVSIYSLTYLQINLTIMKKVLWLMALLLTSMTISAEDLWVRGLNGNWDNTDANKLTLVEGTTDQYILADFTITQKCKFVIANSDYSTKYARWDEYGTEINADNLSLKLGPNGGDVACNVTGTFDIKFDMSNTTVTFVSKGGIVTPDPVVSYGVHGQFTNSDWSTTDMTKDADGNWTCTITPTIAGGSFGIRRYVNGTVPETENWLRCAEETELSESNATINVSLTGTKNPTYALTTGKAYTFTFDPTDGNLTITWATTPDPDPVVTPETLYLRGHINATGWTPSNAVAMTKEGNVFTVTSSVVDVNEGYGYISFSVANGTAEDDAASDWDTNVNSADRFGPATADTEAAFDTDMPVTTYAAGVNASACTSWKVRTGTNMTFIVTFTADGATMKITDFVGVEDITLGAADDVQYYNLQGARVENPAAGIYIEVRGTTARKVAIK